MQIHFSVRKLQKLCNSKRELQRAYGQRLAESIAQRLTELTAAETLSEVSRLPPARCHELGQDRNGQLAVDLIHPKRLIFKPDHNPPPAKPDGGLDWTQVTSILVIEIVDYHG